MRQLASRGRRNGNGSDDATSPFVATPLMIPCFNRAVRRFNRQSILHTYQRLAHRHQISNPIVVTTFPSTVDFVRSLDASLRIYYCVDEWLDYPGIDTVSWRVMENELLAVADGFVSTSNALHKKNREGCPSLSLPHGVDFDHFFPSISRRTIIPAMERIKPPIVGFFGLIGKWVNVRLVQTLASAFPRVSFVLIGARDLGVSQVANDRNIHWLGPVPYGELPNYARYFDVGLIPFVRNRLTEAIHPLKLIEYYALGLPVLATRLPELEKVSGPICLASTDEEFRDGLRTILEGGSRLPNHEAIEVARKNTWEDRAETLSSFIESLLRAKNACGAVPDSLMPQQTRC